MVYTCAKLLQYVKVRIAFKLHKFSDDSWLVVIYENNGISSWVALLW